MVLIIENRREFHTLTQVEPTARSTAQALQHMDWPWPVAGLPTAVPATNQAAPAMPASEERH